MTMSRMQLNSKFINNMLLEWGRFVTAVKLNKGLRDSNYDQLYAYLKQHEAHANENKIMLDRFTQHTMDPLALMSNVSYPQQYSPSSSTPPSTYVQPHLANNAHLDSSLSPMDNLIKNLTNTLALLTQSYKTFLPQTNNQLRTSSNTRNQATFQDGRVVVQNVQGRQNRGQGTNPWGGGAAGHIARNYTQLKHPQKSDYFKDKMLLMQAQENRVALDEEQSLFLAGGQANAIDEDVDEQPAPTTQTMFMANLSSSDHVYDEAGPSYDSDILSEVHDHDHSQDVVCEPHDEHEMHDNVHLNHVVDSHANYTSNSNMILYDQYVKDNVVPGEQVELYERRARFELTGREQKINEQLRIVITDRNFKEETLKEKLHSIKLQLASSINHNKLMVEEVTSLKKNFKQKENQYLEDFLDMKSLKEKNPICLTRAKQVQPALYNGHEIIKDNHVPAIVHNTEDTLEIAEITRRKMNDKMKDPECVNQDVFEELEAAVAQNVVDRKHDKIQQKNLLIANDNLIAECLSKEVFYVATNSELDVSRFSEMHVANTTVEARCLELEAELSNLRDKNHNDNHNELVNCFSNLEITQLTDKVTALQAQNDLYRAENGKIKQHYKELYDSIKITCAKHIEQVMALTNENVNLKAQTLNNVNSVSKDQVTPTVLAPGRTDYPLVFGLRLLKTCDGGLLTAHEFCKKLIGTVRFKNDHFGAIMGYGDYMIESVATACYTQNQSLIHTHHNKTPYELVHNNKPDLTFFRVFGALCYPTNDSEDLGKLQPTADIRIFVGYAPSRKGPAPIFLTLGQISSELVPNPIPAAPYVPLTNKDLEILFQPMFDEYLESHRVE
nr:hypothetical protein [Tanacetum cinerariifolium]